MPIIDNPTTILVVDDAPDTLEVLQRHLLTQGYQIFSALDIRAAIHILEVQPVDLVITDLKMPGASGLDLIRYVRANLKHTEVIVITGYASVEGAVQAVKMGAEEYLPKPFTKDELISAVQRALAKLKINRVDYSSASQTQWASLGLIGNSEAMRKVFEGIAKATSSNKPVLMIGERGTGRELVARAIHLLGPRSKFPFINLTCENLSNLYPPQNRLSSNPNTSPATTSDQSSDCPAIAPSDIFRVAANGTIYLSEIGFAPLKMQVQLMQAMGLVEERLPSEADVPQQDLRLIASTSEDLTFLMSRRAFRQDLYLGIKGFTIEVPPLRHRKDDLPILIHHFASTFAEDCGKRPPHFSDEVIHVFQSYDWPGNLKELRILIRRLVLSLEEDQLQVKLPDLPPSLRFRFSTMTDWCNARTLEELEAEHIHKVLNSVDGNKSRAAEILGINRKTLWDKLKRYSLND